MFRIQYRNERADLENLMMSFLLILFIMGCGGESSIEPRTPVDFPPRAVETFETRTLTTKRESLTIDFATSFKDPEGSVLRFSAESSNASVVMVAMSGSVLTITPLTEGSATVSVRASDPGGNSAMINIYISAKAPVHLDDDGIHRSLPSLVVAAGRVEYFEMSAQGSGFCIVVRPSKDLRIGVRCCAIPVSQFTSATPGRIRLDDLTGNSAQRKPAVRVHADRVRVIQNTRRCYDSFANDAVQFRHLHLLSTLVQVQIRDELLS